MSKQKYLKKWVMMWCLLLTVLSGCGVKDKALVLTSQETKQDDGAGEFAEIAGQEPGSTDGQGQESVEDAAAKKQEAALEVIYVHVCGAVMAPGVVELPADSRAEDALTEVGGFAEDADTCYVNLASRVTDGQQLYFPTLQEAEKLRQEEALQQSQVALAAGGMVNINTAGIEQLCTLPGIGEARAQAIIAYREQQGLFRKPEDIMRVDGIKESAYQKIQDKILTE